jgi:hypothetical protein
VYKQSTGNTQPLQKAQDPELRVGPGHKCTAFTTRSRRAVTKINPRITKYLRGNTHFPLKDKSAAPSSRPEREGR